MANLKNLFEKVWFSLLLFTIICIGVSRVLHEEPLRRRIRQEPIIRNDVTSSKPSTQPLNQMENRINELNENVLIFNRVPKAGSEMLVLLLQWLQGFNGFRHVRLPGGHRRRLLRSEQESLVNEVWRIARKEKLPLSFDRHVYFINFTEFEKQQPVYINLIRDPVDKIISRFYYGRVTPNPLNPDIKFATIVATKKKTFDKFEECLHKEHPECTYYSGQPYDLAVPYFCGHYRQCMILNDRWALARAKKNIEKFFPVVGVLEEVNATLLVLEKKLPQFFRGVSDVYFNQLLKPHRNANFRRPRTIDPSVRNLLKSQLTAEYDLYHWVKGRLLREAEVT